MHKDEINQIFSNEFVGRKSFELWERHLHWLASLGWTRAYEKIPVQETIQQANSQHEVVDMLYEFIQKTGYVNAHLGLTSSDIIDNVRLMQVQQGMKIISAAVLPVLMKLNTQFNHPNHTTLGYTHWQPAAPITWRHRVNAWLEPINFLMATRPAVYAKKFGGPVGDSASLKLVVHPDVINDNPFDWSPFDLDYPNNPFPLQSSDYACEMAAVNWCCAIAARIHKIALDLRFLASHNLVKISRPLGHAGSSSMPHKTNPYKWEKVCSICRSLSSVQGDMWAISANNSLERTLDGSWQIKSVLRRTFHDLAYALEEMAAVDCYPDWNASSDLLREFRGHADSDMELTQRVLAGETRWSAYNDMLSGKKTKS